MTMQFLTNCFSYYIGQTTLSRGGNDVIKNLNVTSDDQIYAGAGNDTIASGAGADSIDGGIGADTMIGGTGNDTYVVNNIWVFDSCQSVNFDHSLKEAHV